MKTRMPSSYLGAGTAVLVAVLALAACQNPDSPVPSALAEKDSGEPAAQIPTALAPEGRKATDEEIARLLASRREDPSEFQSDSQAPLAKAAALPICRIDFNQVEALDRLPDDGYLGLSFSPHYAHSCNSSYLAHAVPVIGTHYRLPPEAAKWCSVAPDRIGTRMLRGCINQQQAIYWPRRAGTIGDTGVHVYVKNVQGSRRNFDLRSISIHSGTAEVYAFIPGIGWRAWGPLTAGTRWDWPAGSRVTEIQVFPHGMGSVEFDNLEIAIHP